MVRAATRSQRALRAIDALQARVQRDEGKRGIGALFRPGQLLAAAELMLSPPSTERNGAVLLTGFPCLRECTPPAESDGPPGTMALAQTMLALGRSVIMPIEDHSAHVLRSVADASSCSAAEVASFPTADRWTAADDARLDALRAHACVVLSLERAGDSSDGVCYTMRGLEMGPSLLGRLNRLGTPGMGVPTVAIGDGGNELGMGSLRDAVAATVPLGERIGCVVPADATLAASVSNWGGYALSCAIAILAWEDGLAGAAGAPGAYLRRLVPDAAQASAALLACSAAGALDGITRQGGGAVDGMPLETQLATFDDLRALALEAME